MRGFSFFVFVVPWVSSLFWYVSLVYYYLCILAFLVSDSFFVICAKCIDLWAICEKIYSDSIRAILRIETIHSNLAAPEVSTLCYYPIPCLSYLRSYYVQVNSFFSFFPTILFPLFNFLSNKFSPGNCCSPFPPLPLPNSLEKGKKHSLRSYLYLKWNNINLQANMS